MRQLSLRFPELALNSFGRIHFSLADLTERVFNIMNNLRRCALEAGAIRKIGTVEKIEYTFHGFGNQYTTINGKEYITFWDFADGVCVGARVEFSEEENGRVSMGNLNLVGPKARDIRVIERPERRK
jgi:hypothetical protein